MEAARLERNPPGSGVEAAAGEIDRGVDILSTVGDPEEERAITGDTDAWCGMVAAAEVT